MGSLIGDVFAFAVLASFVVGLSALGGYIGEYCYAEDVFRTR